MRKPAHDQFNHIQESLNNGKEKALMPKGSSFSQNHAEGIKNGNNDSFITFSHNQYPFAQSVKQAQKIFKTVVNSDISHAKLQKIIKLHHANIINIQKITRGHSKSGQNQQTDVFYSFYFQSVPFSIKKIIISNDNYSDLIFQVASINLGKILRNVSDYLMKEGIYNIFRLQDIGITRSAEVKVYISPLLMCGPSGKIVNHKAVMNSIDKLVGWWQTSLTSNQIINPINHDVFDLPQFKQLDAGDEKSISHSQKSNKSSSIHNKINQVIQNRDQQKKTRFSQTKSPEIKKIQIKSCNNSHSSQISMINAIQLEKMKKIDQEIKFIRQRLKEKAIKKKHNESDNQINKSKEYTNKRKKSSDIFEREPLEIKREQVPKNVDRKRFSKGYTNPESVQHINCINIYNNPPAQIASPHIPFQSGTKQPLYTFTVTSNTPIEPHCHSPTPNRLPSFTPDDFPQAEESVDTYQMQLNPHFQQISGPQDENFQNAVIERQLSEHQFKPKENNKKIDIKGSNQVINKHIHESAGPLQYKNFVNKCIKPQFLAKRSNIYEDPGQYESEQSKSVSKKFENHCTDLFQAGKSATSKTQKTGSRHNNDNANEPSFQPIRANTLPKQSSNLKTESIPLIDLDNKYTLQKQSATKNCKTIINSKASQQAVMGERIKKVLEKTKQAIAQLNRAKACYRSLPK